MRSRKVASRKGSGQGEATLYQTKDARQREALRGCALNEDGKIDLLSRTIRDAAQRSGAVTELDLTQSGLPVKEAKRLYEPAMQRARDVDPRLFGIPA
jgi:hypothetical protein